MNRPKNTGTTRTLLIIFIIAVAVNFFVFGSLYSTTTPADTVNLRTAPEYSEEEETPRNPLPDNFAPIQISSDEIHCGELILVNNSCEYIFDASPSVITRESVADVYGAKTKDYYIKDTSIDLNPTVISAINKMFADYKAANGKADILINAAYRTKEQQAEMLEAKGPEIATNPGFSEHHSGYAFDICIYSDGVYKTFSDEGHYKWIPENCKKYGFIRRYPEGKTDITGIVFEPWHYRYVGVPHSYYMTENSLTLEEYIDHIRYYTLLGEHLKININDKDYEVYFVPAEEGTTTIYVPQDKAYTLSGNNVDGFIVTVGGAISENAE